MRAAAACLAGVLLSVMGCSDNTEDGPGAKGGGWLAIQKGAVSDTVVVDSADISSYADTGKIVCVYSVAGGTWDNQVLQIFPTSLKNGTYSCGSIRAGGKVYVLDILNIFGGKSFTTCSVTIGNSSSNGADFDISILGTTSDGTAAALKAKFHAVMKKSGSGPGSQPTEPAEPMNPR